MTTDMTGTGTGPEPLDRTAARVAEQAGQTVERQASVSMDRAAQTVDQVATAVRQAGEGLREQQPQIASLADTAARQVEQVGRYLREHEPQEVIGGVESWARRQPALAIGGALALGLLAGRFIRSASPPRQRSSWAGASSGYGYGSDLARQGGGAGYGDSTGMAGSGFAGTGYGTGIDTASGSTIQRGSAGAFDRTGAVPSRDQADEADVMVTTSGATSAAARGER